MRIAIHRDRMAKIIIAVEGIPLMAYPLVLMANVMQVAAFEYWEGSSFSLVSMILFLVLTTVYPFSYLICLWLVFRRAGKHKLRVSLIPAVHLLLVVLFFAWA